MRSSQAKTQEDLLVDRFRERLLAWYDLHARDLPWRKDRDPYRVWVSEIMLQQTRVAAVIEHYHEFLRRFPTVQRLAAAREPSVLSAWSGLGYYRRARMLHAAAKVVVHDREGKFPKTAEDWRVLPGIGRYTAAAIASIASGEPVAVVDGNVERVLQRLIGKRLAGEQFWKAAESLLDRQRAGDFNQAMMELGATVCTPRAPSCLMCPVAELCTTRGEVAFADRARKQTKCEVDYALHRRDSRVYLVQRPKDARLMAGMWELPVVQPAMAHTGEDQIPRSLRNDKKRSRPESPIFTVRHSITVTNYTVRVWNCAPADTVLGKWVSCHSLSKMPLTGLARKVLRKAQVLP
jgi:A/G-specific adenine glycosylase